jgi:predicted ABC-type transport system involved in lysophospholipase L1 biosynthesis ATPase subunit
MVAAPNIIEAEDVHRTYAVETAPVEVLKGVSLQVRRGETVSIMGASGAGKSTLLHILGALDHPTRGRVLFDGEDLYGLSEKQRCAVRSMRMGFVFQAYHLLPELNVLENVVLPARSQRGANWNLPKLERRAADLLDRVGLGHRRRHRPNELSGGEQQRVALARALMNEPDVIMADEPTGNLDSVTGEQVLNCLFDLAAAAGRTVILATHNQEIARRCSRQLRLVDGKLVA